MTAKTDISKCLSLLFGKLKLCIFLSFIVLCLLQPTANYDLAIIEDYLAGNAKIKISIKKQNDVVVIFGEPWRLLLTGSAVPRIFNGPEFLVPDTGRWSRLLFLSFTIWIIKHTIISFLSFEFLFYKY